jgi:hypothetical protein
METLDHLSYQLKDKITINFLTSVGTKDPDLGTIVSDRNRSGLMIVVSVQTFVCYREEIQSKVCT